MMRAWFFSPPVVFVIVISAVFVLNRLISMLSLRRPKQKSGTGEPYACGECNYDHMSQPDYSTFFPFAFFFTLAHVATLIITTLPTETVKAFIIASIYIIGAIVGLYILLKG
jgi:NADH-quinone oxidoreductase subunit A